MIKIESSSLLIIMVLACGISFCSGMTFMGESMSTSYQASVDKISADYQDEISSLKMRGFNMENKLRSTIDVQGKMCTDYMIDMYDAMCDENVKKSTYDFLNNLR